jgi:tetratricopeptide (TPR) repeat protein
MKTSRWKHELERLEKNKEWLKAIRLLDHVIEESPDEVEPYVRVIYLIHNLLVEEDYESYGLNHDYLASLLLNYIQVSFGKFENNPEYLFFVGIILHIAEWYFGQDDVELALLLQKKAVQMEPQNALYDFSYSFSMSNKARSEELAKQLSADGSTLAWLKTKGFPGEYVLGIIDWVNQGKMEIAATCTESG